MIAVPAVVYSIGAYGFFAVPYTILIYPLLYLTMPRLWAVSHKHGYMTASDFVLGRYGNRWLELAVALTGILATMPYIALQLVGLEKVIAALGFSGQGVYAHAPITIAFVILALYTYKSGLRAPAMIAFVKDAMIYIFVIAAIVIIPYELGGFGAIFAAAGKAFAAKVAANPKLSAGADAGAVADRPLHHAGDRLGDGAVHVSARHDRACSRPPAAAPIRFNAITLPAYSLTLGLIALLGLMAIAAGVKVGSPQDAVPQLVLWAFPDWFAGFSFAAIALGALVPAAVMSIGAANTFTRNIWKPFIHPKMDGREESVVAKFVSLVVKIGALAVIFFMPTQFALDLQLLGGVWMIQIFPALVLGLFTRWFSGSALLIGWAVGMMRRHRACRGPRTGWAPVHALKWDIPFFGHRRSRLRLCRLQRPDRVRLNLVVAALLSLVLRPRGVDETAPADYED